MAFFNSLNNSVLPGSNNTWLGGSNSWPSDFNVGTCADNTVAGAGSGVSISSNNNRNSLFGSSAGASVGAGGGSSDDNTCIGYMALYSCITIQNTAIGSYALQALGNGFTNVALGYRAGISYNGNESSNVCLLHEGVNGESNTLRLGTPYTGGGGVGEQLHCYIAGINNAPLSTPTGYDYLMIDEATSEVRCISQTNFPGVIITTYNTPGTYTWTKNARTKNVQVYGWTGGSGGGSGRKGSNTIAGGGTGGSAGSSFFMECPASFLAASETVVVGAGGAGGAGQSANDTDGNVGVLGGISSFGNLIPAINVEGGQGGVNGSGAGLGPWYYVNQQLWNFTNPLSGSGTNSTGNNAENAGMLTNRGMTPTGGGGGGGTGSFSGGSGGNVLNMAGTGTYLGGGVGGTNSPGSPGNNAPTSTAGGIVCGGTGGGGGATGGSQSYNGGNGGFPGGGGGGGGGGLNGTFNSANGGRGGDGLIMVLEFC